MGHSTRRKAQKNAHIGAIWCHSVRSRWQVLGGKRLHDLEFLRCRLDHPLLVGGLDAAENLAGECAGPRFW